VTLIAMTGFESGDLNEHTISAGGSYQPTLTVENTAPRTGDYHLRVNKTSGTANNSYQGIRFSFTATQELYLSCGIRVVTGCSAGSFFISLGCDASRHLCFTQWYSGSGSTVNLDCRHYRSYDASTGSAFAATIDTWYRLSAYLKIADAPDGIARWWIDGTLVSDFSGDTRNAGTADLTYAFFGGGVDGAVHTSYQQYLDDIVLCTPAGTVNNGVPGNVKIYRLSPNAVGNYTQLTPSAGSNYDCVDEIPPVDADYVHSSTLGQKDTYGLSNMPVSIGAVRAIQTIHRGLETPADGNKLARLLRLRSNDYQGSDVAQIASFAYFKEILESNPLTATQWAIGALNELEAGEVVR
jgi:hypothetical protein